MADALVKFWADAGSELNSASRPAQRATIDSSGLECFGCRAPAHIVAGCGHFSICRRGSLSAGSSGCRQLKRFWRWDKVSAGLIR
jgi:hypothetical protein